MNADYSYNTDNTLASITNKHNNITISSHVYGYDTLANRNTHAETINGSTINYVYGYDELNRLIQVSNGNAAQQENYTYDALNNRTTQTIGTTTTAYVYDAANQLQDIHAGTATGTLLADLNYDANGNLITRSDLGATYTYDARNRLTQVAQTGITTQTYGYDDQGQRIQKTTGAETRFFLYNGAQLIEEYINNWTSTPTQYTHGARLDEIVIKQTASAAQYYHQDGLNSLVAITSNTGTTDATQKFNAWGNINAATGVSQYFGYTGREKDETGLMYYRARYYAPDIGRFTQQDPIGLMGGLNYFSYVFNNPINFNDPTGLRPGDVYGVGPSAYGKVSFRDYVADQVNLTAQNIFYDNSKYVHLVTEILPDMNGNRRIAEATPEGVKIVDYNVWIKKELGEGRAVDEYRSLIEPSEDSLVFLTLFATVFEGSNYDWSAYYGDIDTNQGEFICSEFCNASLLFSGLDGIDQRLLLGLIPVMPMQITDSDGFRFNGTVKGGGFVIYSDATGSNEK